MGVTSDVPGNSPRLLQADRGVNVTPLASRRRADRQRQLLRTPGRWSRLYARLESGTCRRLPRSGDSATVPGLRVDAGGDCAEGRGATEKAAGAEGPAGGL